MRYGLACRWARRLFAAPLVLFPSLVVAGEIHVPDDYPDVQQAIDAASPGDTIVVRGGTWPPITITKPLVLVGDPVVTFDDTEPVASSQKPCIRLAGSGQGRVVLAQVRTTGHPTSFTGTTGEGVFGGGFDELSILRSDIRSPDWIGPDGLGFGNAGVKTTIPFLLIASSSVRGGVGLLSTDDEPGHRRAPAAVERRQTETEASGASVAQGKRREALTETQKFAFLDERQARSDSA